MSKGSKSRALVLSKKVNGQLVKYNQMCSAIDACHGFDECKDIIDKSVAMAAYYKQIKDTETEVMFYRVRLRAWRRIAELFSSVDMSDIPVSDSWQAKGWVTMTSKVRRIRESFPNDPTVADMSDARIAEILKLMAISNAEFEHAINQRVAGSIVDLLRRTPTAEAQMAKAEKQRAAYNKRWEKERAAEAAKNHADAQAKFKEARMREKHEQELDTAAEEAMEDVGITLERKDRSDMKQVVFLIKASVHEVMRQAAFDKKITMQDVLRRGLRLWLEANGYRWPDGNNNDGTRGYRNTETRPT